MAKYIWDYSDNITKSHGPGTEYLTEEPEEVLDFELKDELGEPVEIGTINPSPEKTHRKKHTRDDEYLEETPLSFGDKDESDDSIKYYLEDISRYKLLTADEEKDLSKRIQNGEERALDKLIQSNLRLVVKIAKQYVSNEYPLVDIIQDGNLGLIRACQKFDYRKNVRFSTYASWWIKQTIVRSLSIRKRMIRIPHRKEEKFRKIKKAMDVYYQKFHSNPSHEELSDLTSIPADEIDEVYTSMVNVVSYENTFVEDENCTILNLLSDNKEKPDEMIFEKQLEEETKTILATLNPKEREVLIRRYGFDSGERHTLKAMGNSLGISAETIRQIEIKAIRKLRLNFKHLKDYLN